MGLYVVTKRRVTDGNLELWSPYQISGWTADDVVLNYKAIMEPGKEILHKMTRLPNK